MNHFILTSFKKIDNEEYRKIMTSSKGIMLTYFFLKRYVIRAGIKNNSIAFKIYKKFYEKGFLASSVSINILSERLGLSKNTLLKNLSILEKCGLIRVKTIKTSIPYSKNQTQNVYIMGKWIEEYDESGLPKIKEWWFEDSIFK